MTWIKRLIDRFKNRQLVRHLGICPCCFMVFDKRRAKL